MLHEEWTTVKRILVIQAGARGDVAAGAAIESLAEPIARLQHAAPQADIVLLCAPTVSQTALALPDVAEILIHPAASEQELSDSTKALDLTNVLRSENFDVAIVFSDGQTSPHPFAYMCYLAGIPIRIGQSQEFGGGVLTDWVKQRDAADHPIELLNAIGIGA
ncbi:MAG: hypothetical protein KME43_12855 [Myxacorys chilensis ATA2-1-KO14]|jgi:ADP-heptose:LPS heptosyltransferase|nr:hypothetical protein [Myxacorys chilensis ATA2-1-KO14]